MNESLTYRVGSFHYIRPFIHDGSVYLDTKNLFRYILAHNKRCSNFDRSCDQTTRLCGQFHQCVVNLTFPYIKREQNQMLHQPSRKSKPPKRWCALHTYIHTYIHSPQTNNYYVLNMSWTQSDVSFWLLLRWVFVGLWVFYKLQDYLMSINSTVESYLSTLFYCTWIYMERVKILKAKYLQ